MVLKGENRHRESGQTKQSVKHPKSNRILKYSNNKRTLKWKTDESKKERRKKGTKKLKVIVLKNGNIIFLLLLLCRFFTKEFFPPHFFTIQQKIADFSNGV